MRYWVYYRKWFYLFGIPIGYTKELYRKCKTKEQMKAVKKEL
jgi:hypothetical protein